MGKEIILENLKKSVAILAAEIGSRGHLETERLDRTAGYIQSELEKYGYPVSTQPYEAESGVFRNVYTVKKGAKHPDSIIVIGAHYDTVAGTPGADDNASGVAGILELARLLKDEVLDRTLHFVSFPLEEPPYFRSRFMGSYVYAEKLHKEGANVEGMICLESIGYFSDAKGSQYYPVSLFRFAYPDRGDFISFVGNLQSKRFLENAKTAFKKATSLPVESLSSVSLIPGVDFSDQRSFWKFGYNAFMITDTAFYRNPHYHGPGDLPETLDFKRMTEVVIGLQSAIEETAGVS